MNPRTINACPFCQVAPGEPCIGANGRPRLSVHEERWQGVLAVRRKRNAKAVIKKVKEGNIRDLLKARIEAYGGTQRAVSWIGRAHAPDVLALFPDGSAYDRRIDYCEEQHVLHPFIETKRPGKAATEGQAREHERMRAAGCIVLVITTEQELDAWLPPL